MGKYLIIKNIVFVQVGEKPIFPIGIQYFFTYMPMSNASEQALCKG
jgi:hypothetical protein